MFSAFGSSGGGFFCKKDPFCFGNINMSCIFVETKSEKMSIVNFFMPVEIATGHPEHIMEAAFLGRAIIEQEADDEFTADGINALIQDLFFLHDTTRPTESATRVPLPDPKTSEGRMFRSRLETAAKEAYWNGYAQTEFLLPDDLRQ